MKAIELPILHLNLKRIWFDMILAGVKKEEYRVIKQSWNRIFGRNGIKIKGKYYHPTDIIICFSNGYKKNRLQMMVECKYKKVSEGREDWGAKRGEQYYTLILGKVVKK